MTFSKRLEKLSVLTRSTHSSRKWVTLENKSSRFATHDIVSALAIFDPRNVPSTDSSQFPTYRKKSIAVLLSHLGRDKFALTLNDDEKVMTAIISPEVHTEWITFHT